MRPARPSAPWTGSGRLKWWDEEGRDHDSMSRVYARGGGVSVLQLEDVDDFAARCPEQYAAILEASAFVNWRRIEQGGAAVLALSFFKHP